MNIVQLTDHCVVREEAIQAVKKFFDYAQGEYVLRVYISGDSLEFFGGVAKHVLRQLQEYTTFGRILADWSLDELKTVARSNRRGKKSAE